MTQDRYTDEDLPLFVYGTLRPGQQRWSLIEDMVEDTQPGLLRGYRMFHLPEGYPALIEAPEGQGRAVGDLLLPRGGMEADFYAATDQIECYNPEEPNSLYKRVVAGTGHARAFLYVYHPDRAKAVEERGELVPHGNWTKFIGEST